MNYVNNCKIVYRRLKRDLIFFFYLFVDVVRSCIFGFIWFVFSYEYCTRNILRNFFNFFKYLIFFSADLFMGFLTWRVSYLIQSLYFELWVIKILRWFEVSGLNQTDQKKKSRWPITTWWLNLTNFSKILLKFVRLKRISWNLKIKKNKKFCVSWNFW